MMDIWTEKIKIRFASVDRSDRLTLWSIFNYFQEAAISHATELGVGREAMASQGQAWILSRLSLFVGRRPAYGENIELSTWPRRWEKLFALRDYSIRGERGDVLARARSGWLILDTEKRRPLRPQAVADSIPPNDGVDAFPGSPESLDRRNKLQQVSGRVALYSDIDYYGHANNARYIQWVQDVTDIDILTKADQIRFDINYLSEVMPGDTVELWTAPIIEESREGENYPASPGPGFAYEGRRPGTEHAMFRAELRTGTNYEKTGN